MMCCPNDIIIDTRQNHQRSGAERDSIGIPDNDTPHLNELVAECVNLVSSNVLRDQIVGAEEGEENQ